MTAAAPTRNDGDISARFAAVVVAAAGITPPEEIIADGVRRRYSTDGASGA